MGVYTRVYRKNVPLVPLVPRGEKCEREKLKNGCESRLKIWEAERSNLRAPEMMECPTESFFFRVAGFIW
nr:MAG TPA: hypothetical protein [Caudoviricetes sp.]